MNTKIEAVKIAADTTTGVTIGEATDTNGLLITIFTIVSRLILEAYLNRRERKKAKKQAENEAKQE